VVAALRAAGCVFAEDEASVLRSSASSPAALGRLLARRVAGEPLEVVVGWASFAGIRVLIDPGVFVPRRRSELLVDLASAIVRDDLVVPGGHERQDRGELSGVEIVPDANQVSAADRVDFRQGLSVVVDLCCGSGAVGAAIAARMPTAEVYAADVDPAAVACARRNLPPDHVFEGDLYDALPMSLRGRVDVLVANAPYVPSDAIATMPTEARDHEPRVALDGGADGVDLHRRIAASARDWLAPGGRLIIESSRSQADQTAEAMRNAGLVPRVETDDDREATAVVGITTLSATPPRLVE
jgi:release factor glutamine methyltransferase